jgi:hypoxanthine phosphoribosyltransferase
MMAKNAAESQDHGDEITAAYPDGELLVLGLLKGSFIFLSDLVRAVTRPLQVDFLVAASYGDQMASSGNVRLVYDPETKLEGKHILLVEDIVDSGLTLNYLLRNLRSRNPASLEVLSLLAKPGAAEIDVPIRYLGFEIPDVFVVGYGLDYAERYRNLPFVASLRPEVDG